MMSNNKKTIPKIVTKTQKHTKNTTQQNQPTPHAKTQKLTSTIQYTLSIQKQTTPTALNKQVKQANADYQRQNKAYLEQEINSLTSSS